MTILPIIKVPNETLTTTAKEVKKIDKRVLKLVRDMKHTLKAQRDPEGVGLAAPQIGESLRLFIILSNERFKTFINPKITWFSKKKYRPVQAEKKPFLEGCLSIPGIYGRVERANALEIKYFDEKKKEHKERYEGLPAVYIQHEYDHINGILFTARVLEQGGKLYRLIGDQWKEIDI